MTFKADGEPPLAEVLGDPILHLLIQGDGVSLEELRYMIEAARNHLLSRGVPSEVGLVQPRVGTGRPAGCRDRLARAVVL